MKILDTPRSGKCANVVAFQSRYGLCLREWVVPRNTASPARRHMRAIFGRNSQMWSSVLTQDQRDRWNAAGPQVMSRPQLAQKGPLTGQQFWQGISTVRSLVGLQPDLEPPAPVAFTPSVVGRLSIENGEDGVRLWLAVSGQPDTDIMVFGQEPCPAGRSKRRNVAYLGLLPPPTGGRCEITHLYKARYGEPRPGRKVFVVTCQTRDGWKGIDQETNEIVPERPKDLQASAQPLNSQNPYMHKGGTTDAQGKKWPVDSPFPQGAEAAERGGKAAGAGFDGREGGGGGAGPPARTAT
jgi:hypothetical protein